MSHKGLSSSVALKHYILGLETHIELCHMMHVQDVEGGVIAPKHFA